MLEKVSGTLTSPPPPPYKGSHCYGRQGGQSSCACFLMGKLRHKAAKSRVRAWLGRLVTCDVTPCPLLNWKGSLGSCKMLGLQAPGLGDRAASRPQDMNALGSVQPTASGACSSAWPAGSLERRVGAAGLRTTL